LIMPMTMVIGIGLGKTCMGSISGHHDNNSKHHPFSNYKKIHKYLIKSLLSPILHDNYENIP
jgi:hypothetical protein